MAKKHQRRKPSLNSFLANAEENWRRFGHQYAVKDKQVFMAMQESFYRDKIAPLTTEEYVAFFEAYQKSHVDRLKEIYAKMEQAVREGKWQEQSSGLNNTLMEKLKKLKEKKYGEESN